MSKWRTVRVNSKAVERLEKGHLWVFTSDIVSRGGAEAGDCVRVVDVKGKAYGTAHFSTTSQIVLRMLSRRVVAIDEEFLFKRLQQALRFREQIVKDTDAYRLVYAEGDLLPGLIVDRYGDYLSVQLLDQGMDRQTTDVVSALTRLVAPRGIVARNDVAVRTKEDLPLDSQILAGEIPAKVEVRMNGLHFGVDLVGGQKTGIFLDQRENYVAVREYARGGRALDCFTGSGGFALHLASGCDSLEAIDSSAEAIEMARGNAAANQVSNVEFREANAFDYLPSLVAGHRLFDLVVVDPPAFTKSREAVEHAVRGYREINMRALRVLQPGGILVSCSCSHHMSEAHLLETVAQAARDCGKRLRLLERRSQAHDHPVLLTVPETQYLKCLIFQDLAES